MDWQMRSRMLLGEEGLEKLRNARVLVAGLGGVGAYAAEMLCRAGVGHLIIADSDLVSASNRNRQLLALCSTLGQPKTAVMRLRLEDINPEIEITEISTYLNEESIPGLLEPIEADYIVDAIDTLSPKIALICYARSRQISLVSAMGAGAKKDATAVRLCDISKTYNCPLAFMLRKRLRKLGVSKGFKAVFSTELPDYNAVVPCEEQNKKSQVGSISYLPAVFGCVCAQAVVEDLLKDEGLAHKTIV